jgi:hypothetical protein
MTSAEASLVVHVGLVRPDHSAALAATSDLLADLQREPQLRARERNTDKHGTKGAIVDLVVSLSGPSSLAALTRIIRLWLDRDRQRSMTISVRKDGKETTIKVDGSPISTENLAEALSAAALYDETASSE